MVTGFDNIEHASLSDVGIRRSHNQDNHAILLAGEEEQWRLQGHIFIVADGMGGHAVGELASKLAVDIIPHTYHKYSTQGPVPALRKAFLEANASIHSRGQANREFEGMGTTATTLLLRPEGAWIGHVGDSRTYRIRNGRIEQLSYDHSYVWEVARQLHIDPEGVEGPSNVLIRSLGPVPLVEVDLEGPHPLQDGDIFLMCSDGLTGQITDHEIGAVASVLAPAEACRFLIDLANLRGGPDNITVVIVRVGKGPLPGSKPVEPPLAKKPRRPPLPRHVLILLLGAFLAALATWFTVYGWQVAGVATFLFAVLDIVAGLAALFLHQMREKNQATAESEAPELKVYRQAPCQIDRPLVDKLLRAVQSLHQRAVERQWNADWDGYKRTQELAEKYLSEGDLVGAFRELCRTMRVLMQARPTAPTNNGS